MITASEWETRGLKSLSTISCEELLFEAPVRLGRIRAQKLSVGAWSYIQGDALLGGEVAFGRYCSIASHLTAVFSEHPTDWLSSSTAQYQRSQFDFWMKPDLALVKKEITRARPRRLDVGNDVWIGHGVLIMNGVRIGDGAVIAAGSVVTRDVPDYAIYAGVPARLVRMRFPDDLIERLQRVQWWRYDRNDMGPIPFDKPAQALDAIEEQVAAGVLSPRPKAFQKGPASLAAPKPSKPA